jgi:hypothetical protein
MDALVFMVAAVMQAAPPSSTEPPCGRVAHTAWLDAITTNAQRTEITETIARHTVQGATNWNAAAIEYFLKRWKEKPTSVAVVVPTTGDPDFGKMQENGEQALREKLIDPRSSEFRWPHGFALSSWRPSLSKKVEGYVTCGTVNSKNRMGGYTGNQYFVVVLKDYKVIYSDIDSGSSLNEGIVSSGCNKTGTTLPPPQKGMVADRQLKSDDGSSMSVADEIMKLDQLRAKGVLTQVEFDEQKRKLLSRAN